MFWISIISTEIIFYWKFFDFKFSFYFKTEKKCYKGLLETKKIKPPYSSNLGEALEAFLDHLMPIRKGHHLTGKQGIEVCDAAFTGTNGEHLADFPGKSSGCSSAA